MIYLTAQIDVNKQTSSSLWNVQDKEDELDVDNAQFKQHFAINTCYHSVHGDNNDDNNDGNNGHGSATSTWTGGV